MPNLSLSSGKKNVVFLCALAVWLCFLMGTIFPEPWWGSHFLAFLPTAVKVTFLTFSAGLIALGRLRPQAFGLLDHQHLGFPKWLNWVIPPLLAGLMALLYWNINIYAVVYGDGPRFLRFLETLDFAPRMDRALGLNIFDAKNGEITVLNFMQYLGGENTRSFYDAFRLMGGICGFLFVWLWLAFLFRYFKEPGWRFLFGLIGLTAPMVLLFCGHLEIYAPGLTSMAAYLAALLLYFERRKVVWLVLLIPLQFLALKFHASSFLLFPSLVFAFTFHFAPKMRPFLKWKWIGIGFMAVVFLAGACLYFFVLEDHHDSRILEKNIDPGERTFLPLFTPSPPYHKYNLFSWNHIFDFFNIVLLWSGAGLAMMLTFFVGFRRKIKWNQPGIFSLSITLVLYVSLFFMINPLLSMPFDWDLYMLTSVPFLFLLVALARHLSAEIKPSHFAGPVIAFALLGLSFFWINHVREPLSYRIESMGKHVYKTYWSQGVGFCRTGISLMKDDREMVLDRWLKIRQELQPSAIIGVDEEFAIACYLIGKIYRTEIGNQQLALKYHKMAQLYDPGLNENLVGLLETHYLLADFPEAYQVALQLLNSNYPSQEKALRIAIHVALEAGMYDEALQHSKTYLHFSPRNTFIGGINRNLKEGTNLDQLKYQFRSN